MKLISANGNPLTERESLILMSPIKRRFRREEKFEKYNLKYFILNCSLINEIDANSAGSDASGAASDATSSANKTNSAGSANDTSSVTSTDSNTNSANGANDSGHR